MPDLAPAHVASLAAALGLPVSAEDLPEVTHRLNGFIEALGALAGLPLERVEPRPVIEREEAPPPASASRPSGAGGRRGEGAPRSGDDEIVWLPAVEQAALIRAGKLSPVALTQAYLDRIERLDGRLRAYITVCADEALGAARAAEEQLAGGRPLGPLHGIPFAIKDQFDVAGMRTTGGSRVLSGDPASADATVVARLRAAGGILLGKLNLSELALGDTVDFPFGQPRNPWSLDHHPGGSSGGSGAATAAALCSVSLGEDTGGSVRGPAANCGVVGLRPTWGRLSRHGCLPLAWSLDAPGPLTRTVADCALLLELAAGADPADPTASRRPVPDVLGALTGDVRGLRIGCVQELVTGPDTDPEVTTAVTAAARVLRELGAAVDDVSLPLAPLAGAIGMAVTDTAGAGLHARWLRTRPRDLDRNTRRRLLAASLLPATLAHQAERGRALVRGQIDEALARFDLLLFPTSPRPAPRIADGRAPITSKEAAAGRFFTRRAFGAPAALAGVPAISVPCGFSGAGLPIGLQLIGRAFDEPTVLRAAHAYEQATDWHRRRPTLAGS